MAKHTKGPWTVGQTTGLRETILSPQGGMIAKVLTKGTLNNYANANLIAAAPEMLDALEQALAIIDDGENAALQNGKSAILYYFEDSDIEKLKTVISKAKGEL